MSQSSDLIFKLCRDTRLKLGCQSVIRTCEHKVLPNHKTEFVAKIIEIIRRIHASAPNTDAVEIRFHARLKQLLCPLLIGPRKDVVLRDIVRAHRKELHTVNNFCELRAVLIFFGAHFEPAKTDTLCIEVKDISPLNQLCDNRVKRLLSESVRPPEEGIRYTYVSTGFNPFTDSLTIRVFDCYKHIEPIFFSLNPNINL